MIAAISTHMQTGHATAGPCMITSLDLLRLRATTFKRSTLVRVLVKDFCLVARACGIVLTLGVTDGHPQGDKCLCYAIDVSKWKMIWYLNQGPGLGLVRFTQQNTL